MKKLCAHFNRSECFLAVVYTSLPYNSKGQSSYFFCVHMFIFISLPILFRVNGSTDHLEFVQFVIYIMELIIADVNSNVIEVPNLLSIIDIDNYLSTCSQLSWTKKTITLLFCV